MTAKKAAAKPKRKAAKPKRKTASSDRREPVVTSERYREEWTADVAAAIAEKKPSAVLRKRRATRHRRHVAAMHTLRETVGDIEPGDSVFVLTAGGFSMVEFIEHVLRQTGPADVDIVTFTVTGAEVSYLYRLALLHHMRSVRFVVDANILQRHEVYGRLLRERFGDDAVRSARLHAKWTTIRNERYSIVMTGSLNLTYSPAVEQVEINDDPELAGFLTARMDAIFRNQEPGTFGTPAGDVSHAARLFEIESVAADRDGTRNKTIGEADVLNYGVRYRKTGRTPRDETDTTTAKEATP